MTMKRLLLGMVIVLLASAYLAGYWPENQRRVAIEGELVVVRAELDEARARVRVATLIGDLLYISDAVAALNFTEAQTLSTAFFDAVRAAAASLPVADARSALEEILQQRDATTAAIARGDQGVLELLRRMQLDLRRALASPVASTPPAT